MKLYIDGDSEYPTMADNGTEDYFGGVLVPGGAARAVQRASSVAERWGR